MIAPALDTTQLCFSFLPSRQDEALMLRTAFRLRGSLGLCLKRQCCHFDAEQTPCDGCGKRAYCHYGQSFETPKSTQALGEKHVAGSMPHAWALAVDKRGLRVVCTLTLAGKEQVWLASWRQAIQALDLNIRWEEVTPAAPFGLRWQSLTLVRLRYRGKTPRTPEEIGKAMCASVVQKSKALAAWHDMALPEARLKPPVCSQAQWFEAERYAYRYQETQKLGGWMLEEVHWHDVPEDWLSWLRLSYMLGIGRQTSFGLGRFQILEKH